MIFLQVYNEQNEYLMISWSVIRKYESANAGKFQDVKLQL